jgi:hypothetical protein
VLLERRLETPPWYSNLVPIIREFSTNADFRPYDLLEELSIRGLLDVDDQHTTARRLYRQAPDEYVESWHSRNGFSRHRMGERAKEFDLRVKEVLAPYVRGGFLEFPTQVRLAWGRPTAAT